MDDIDDDSDDEYILSKLNTKRTATNAEGGGEATSNGQLAPGSSEVGAGNINSTAYENRIKKLERELSASQALQKQTETELRNILTQTEVSFSSNSMPTICQQYANNPLTTIKRPMQKYFVSTSRLNSLTNDLQDTSKWEVPDKLDLDDVGSEEKLIRVEHRLMRMGLRIEERENDGIDSSRQAKNSINPNNDKNNGNINNLREDEGGVEAAEMDGGGNGDGDGNGNGNGGGEEEKKSEDGWEQGARGRGRSPVPRGAEDVEMQQRNADGRYAGAIDRSRRLSNFGHGDSPWAPQQSKGYTPTGAAVNKQQNATSPMGRHSPIHANDPTSHERKTIFSDLGTSEEFADSRAHRGRTEEYEKQVSCLGWGRVGGWLGGWVAGVAGVVVVLFVYVVGFGGGGGASGLELEME